MRIRMIAVTALVLAGCMQQAPAPGSAEPAASSADGAPVASTPREPVPGRPASDAAPVPPAPVADTPAAQPSAPAQEPGAEVAHYIARGTEPFWAVEASDAGLLLKTPENQAGEALPARRQPTLRGMRWAGTRDGREYALGIVEGECSDGMSDRRYPYQATWIHDGVTSKGCAERVD